MSCRAIAGQCETAGRSPLKRTSANHTETPNRRRATRPARNIAQHSRTPPPGIRGILPVVPPQTGVYAADAYRPGKRRVATMHRKQSRFPWSPGGAARRDHLQAAAETAPAGRSRALTPRLNQAISSRHDFLHLRQKRGREIDDMKAHRRGIGGGSPPAPCLHTPGTDHTTAPHRDRHRRSTGS